MRVGGAVQADYGGDNGVGPEATSPEATSPEATKSEGLGDDGERVEAFAAADGASGSSESPDEYQARPEAIGAARTLAFLIGGNHPALRPFRLGDDDVARYRHIFEFQANSQWDAADSEISGLRDRRLLGQVERQRYLQQSSPRAGYDELRLWLKRNGDQAGAERIYALALARQPKSSAPLPELPGAEPLNGALEEKATAGEGVAGMVAPRSRSFIRRVAGGPVYDRIEGFLRAGKVGAALKVLGDDALTRRLEAADYDTLRTHIAAALFYDGSTRTALSLASASAARSGEDVPSAYWIAGMAAWRQGDTKTAAQHFQAMAVLDTLPPWQASGAAFWAARATGRCGSADDARRWLERAARFDRTFYGQIAARMLGRASVFQWRVPRLSVRHLIAIGSTKNGYRAIAMLQIGQYDLAEQALRRIHPRGNALLAEALVALANDAGLPALALRVGNAVAAPDGATYDAALYPLPHWTPPEGFNVDRALLFAIMRQESRFETRLISRAGATGVMQLMPETAHDVGGGGDYTGAARPQLFDPQWNLMLGQRYVATLLASQPIAGNLFHLTAAYNAGPSNLLRWRQDLEGINDPLLFIESIPMHETRDYVRKVLANYWIYQTRLGQPTVTLDAIAAGNWPVYTPAEDKTTQVAIHVDVEN